MCKAGAVSAKVLPVFPRLPVWDGAASGANAVINQTINVGNGTDLAAITQAIKHGTAQALEFANVAYKAGQKRNKYVG